MDADRLENCRVTRLAICLGQCSGPLGSLGSVRALTDLALCHGLSVAGSRRALWRREFIVLWWPCLLDLLENVLVQFCV
ncbi:hypothetical protein HDV63DRAFT_364117 [Trichoderma sp. SZMC 28014]